MRIQKARKRVVEDRPVSAGYAVGLLLLPHAWWPFAGRTASSHPHVATVHQVHTVLMQNWAQHSAGPALQAGVDDVAQVIENIQAGLMKDVQDIHHDPVVDDLAGAVGAVPISHAHLYAFSRGRQT